MTEVLVEVNDHLGVGLRREPMTLPLELDAQLAVVVDLAVEHEPNRAVLVRDRLVSRLEIDDREPPETEAERDPVVVLLDVQSLVVRVRDGEGRSSSGRAGRDRPDRGRRSRKSRTWSEGR